MSGRPVFFVVEKTALGESAALYYDDPPQVRTAKPRIIYIVRIDQLPNANIWITMSLAELYAAYCRARDGKRLPPQYIPPKLAEVEKPVVKLGHREQIIRQGSNLPAEPFPTVEDLNRRAKKRRKLTKAS